MLSVACDAVVAVRLVEVRAMLVVKLVIEDIVRADVALTNPASTVVV